MELSVREAATLTGRRPRTLRAQLARGELPGVKRNGRWLIQRRHLPLTEDQRRALQTKSTGIRRLVDEALPSRLARTHGQQMRSLADLETFRRLLALRDRIAGDDRLPAEEGKRLGRHLRHALLDLGEAFHQFDREVKLAAVNRARARLSRLVAAMLADHGSPPAEPVFGWLCQLEQEVLPAVAGLARWIDRLEKKR